MEDKLLKLYKNERLQKLFWKNRKKWEYGDRWCYPATRDTYIVDSIVVPESALHIPDVVSRDPDRPERGILHHIKNRQNWFDLWNDGMEPTQAALTVLLEELADERLH